MNFSHFMTTWIVFASTSLTSEQILFAQTNQHESNQHLNEEDLYSGKVDPYNPSMSGEDAFLRKSQTRLKDLRQQDQRMIELDRQMIKKGYDPNEGFETYQQQREAQLDPETKLKQP